MRKLIVAALLSLGLAGGAYAASRAYTLSGPASYKDAGFRRATLFYRADTNETCLSVFACGNAAGTTVEDCREHNVCTSTPPPAVVNILNYAANAWLAATGY